MYELNFKQFINFTMKESWLFKNFCVKNWGCMFEEQGAEEDIRAYEIESNRKMEKTA
jgi:hypothetical protein